MKRSDMLITIKNDRLTLTVDTLGAQMTELASADGVDYLWNGDERYWRGRAPVLFPFVGRMKDQMHTVNGVKYPMKIHGFASTSEFAVTGREESRLTLTLRDNAATRESYPFAFEFAVEYALCGSTVEITYRVTNHDGQEISFGLGGHPGFRVPLDEGTEFSDYALRFSRPCSPERIGFAEDVLLSGVDTPYPLADGQTIPLAHELFDDDAIFLKNAAREVSLVSAKTRRSVTVSYPDMPYIGFWHKPKTDAPFVCIEPWLSLPGRHGVSEDFSRRADLVRLAPGASYENRWSITIDAG